MEVYEMERAQKRLDKKFEARELLQKGHVKALAISMGLMFFQQLSGINAVMFYSVSIFTEAGSSINSNLATIILGIVNICATIMSNLLIDRLGRKILLYISDIGMICSLAVFGGYFYMKVLRAKFRLEKVRLIHIPIHALFRRRSKKLRLLVGFLWWLSWSTLSHSLSALVPSPGS